MLSASRKHSPQSLSIVMTRCACCIQANAEDAAGGSGGAGIGGSLGDLTNSGVVQDSLVRWFVIYAPHCEVAGKLTAASQLRASATIDDLCFLG